jgi:hypothetical protein
MEGYPGGFSDYFEVTGKDDAAADDLMVVDWRRDLLRSY